MSSRERGAVSGSGRATARRCRRTCGRRCGRGGRPRPPGGRVGRRALEVETVLDAAGIDVFEVIVSAEDVTRGKPDPEGYLRALELLGVEAAEAVALEDAPPGIAAARAAGLRCVAVLGTVPRERLGEADEVVPGSTPRWSTACWKARPPRPSSGPALPEAPPGPGLPARSGSRRPGRGRGRRRRRGRANPGG